MQASIITEPTLRQISLSLLVSSPLSPRPPLTPDDVLDLQKSLAARGQDAPLTVRPSGDGLFEVLDGNRRLKALEILGVLEALCFVVAMTDKEALEFILTTENRKGFDALDLAETIKRQLGKRSPDELAASLGRSTDYLRQLLQLSTILPDLKKLYRSGKLSLDHIKILSRETADTQATALKMLKQRGTEIDPADPADFLRKQFHASLTSAGFDKADASLNPSYKVACNNCERRSQASPSLFPDTKADLCLFSPCFFIKSAAHIKALAKKLGKGGRPVVLISRDFYYGAGVFDRAKVYSSERYVLASKGNIKGIGDPVTGICIDLGPTFGKVEDVFLKWTNVRTADAAETKPAKSPKQLAAQKARTEKARTVKALYAGVVDKLRGDAFLTGSAGEDLTALATRKLSQRLDSSSWRTAGLALGLKKPGGQYPDWRRAVTLSVGNGAALLFALSAADEIALDRNTGRSSKAIEALARRLKVKVADKNKKAGK